MSFNFSGPFQQNHIGSGYSYVHNLSPHTDYDDTPSPTDVAQDYSSDWDEVDSAFQTNNSSDDGLNLTAFPRDLGGQSSSGLFGGVHNARGFTDHFPPHSGSGFYSSNDQQYPAPDQTGSPIYSDNNYYTPTTPIHDIGHTQDGPHYPVIDEYTSSGSDAHLQRDDRDSMISSSEIAPPPAPFNDLPPHDVTESYLRQFFNILPHRPVDLTALPDEPLGKQPKITDLAKLAIWGSASKMLTLQQICKAIEARYPSLENLIDKPWQRSIRHNLSLKAMFVKVDGPARQSGSGGYWTIDVRKGEGNQRPRKGKNTSDAPVISTSNASDDSELDHRTHRVSGSGHRKKTPKRPKNAITLPKPRDQRQDFYSNPEPQRAMIPNMPWNFSALSSHLPTYNSGMMPLSGMLLLGHSAYPLTTMGHPFGELNSLMRTDEPVTGYRHGSHPHGQNSRSTKTSHSRSGNSRKRAEENIPRSVQRCPAH